MSAADEDDDALLTARATREALIFARQTRARVALSLLNPNDASSLRRATDCFDPLKPLREARVAARPPAASPTPVPQSLPRNSALLSARRDVRPPPVSSLADDIAKDAAEADAVAYARAPWIFSAWGASGAEPPSSRDARLAHEAARARIVALLGPALGRTPKTVGATHAPTPLLALRAKRADARASGGPGAFVVSSDAVVDARGQACARARGAPSFARSIRWGDDEHRLARVNGLVADAPAAAPSPSEKGVAAGGCGAQAADTPALAAPTPAATESAESKAYSDDDGNDQSWEDVVFAESKTCEDSNASRAVDASALESASAPSALPTPLASWAAAEAARLRALGARRALERAMFGRPITPSAPGRVTRNSEAGAAALVPVAPADSIRMYKPRAAIIPPLKGSAARALPALRLHHARAAWRAARDTAASAARDAVERDAAPPPTAFLLPRRDFLRDFPPRLALPLGPLSLPGRRAPSESPKLVHARRFRALSFAARSLRLLRAWRREDDRGAAANTAARPRSADARLQAAEHSHGSIVRARAAAAFALTMQARKRTAAAHASRTQSLSRMREPRPQRRSVSGSAVAHTKSLPPRKTANAARPVEEASPRSPVTNSTDTLAPQPRAASPISAFALSVLERVSSAADFEATLTQLRATMNNAAGNNTLAVHAASAAMTVGSGELPATITAGSGEPPAAVAVSNDEAAVVVSVSDDELPVSVSSDEMPPTTVLGSGEPHATLAVSGDEVPAAAAVSGDDVPAAVAVSGDVVPAAVAVSSDKPLTAVELNDADDQRIASDDVRASTPTSSPVEVVDAIADVPALDGIDFTAPFAQSLGDCAEELMGTAGQSHDAPGEPPSNSDGVQPKGTLLASLRAALEESLLSAISDSALVGDDDALRVLMDDADGGDDGGGGDDDSVGLLLGQVSEESDGLQLDESASDEDEAGLVVATQRR